MKYLVNGTYYEVSTRNEYVHAFNYDTNYFVSIPITHHDHNLYQLLWEQFPEAIAYAVERLRQKIETLKTR